MGRMIVALVMVSAGVAAGAGIAATPNDDHPVARVRMVAIFEALSTALNLSLYDTPFAEPENREMIREALDSLAAGAGELDSHGGTLSPAFGYLQNSLARDANEAILRYQQGQYEGARFVLDQLIEKCVACHTRLPGDGKFELGRRFVARSRIEKLPREQRIRLLVATRQFGDACDMYETRFKSDDEVAQDIAAGDAPVEYLKLCVRVLGDNRRAAATLSSFRKRRDVSGLLGVQLDEWVRVLRETDGPLPDGAGLRAARALLEDTFDHNRIPTDRTATARVVVASGMLQRYLAGAPDDATRTAEAYYLLGACESAMERSPGASETEFFLESSVRAAPGSSFAPLALQFLERYLAAQFSDTTGATMPEETAQRLDELRSLVDGAR